MTILVAALHFLALAIGATGIWTRGRGLAAGDVPTVLHGDNLWAVAAIMWLATGLLRAFGGLEKGTDFYLGQPLFWVKMGLFVGILALEAWPMVTFIRWRVARGHGGEADLSSIGALWWVNLAEMVLLALIPFAAAAMVRGVPGW